MTPWGNDSQTRSECPTGTDFITSLGGGRDDLIKYRESERECGKKRKREERERERGRGRQRRESERERGERRERGGGIGKRLRGEREKEKNGETYISILY